jgi:hypothetical protein
MEILKAERQCSEAGFVVKVLNPNIPLLNSSVKNYRHSAGKENLRSRDQKSVTLDSQAEA